MRMFRRRPRPIDCDELVELVTEYFEGLLPVPEVRALEHHLSLCDGCDAYIQQMRDTIRVTGRLVGEDVPPDGVEKLLEMFRELQVSRSDE